MMIIIFLFLVSVGAYPYTYFDLSVINVTTINEANVPIVSGDDFGYSVGSIGDLDGDGIDDVVVGSPEYSSASGAIYVLFLNRDGTVKRSQRIADGEGGFGGDLSGDNFFGFSVSEIGDFDGDNVTDIAVGAVNSGDGGKTRSGSVWILLMNNNGTVKSEMKISLLTEGFDNGTLFEYDFFGSSVCSLGDLDGDNVTDIAVGAQGDGLLGRMYGAVWILFMNIDGTVKNYQKIDNTSFGVTFTNQDNFGSSLASLGDFDGDGIVDIAVGAYGTDSITGAVYILFLNKSGVVKDYQLIFLNGELSVGDRFGSSLSNIGDFDNDGVEDIVVGGGRQQNGEFWVLFLNTNGTVKDFRSISVEDAGILPDEYFSFGQSVTVAGDLDNNGVIDLVVGTPGLGTVGGGVKVLFLNNETTIDIEITTTVIETTTIIEVFSTTVQETTSIGIEITTVLGTTTDVEVISNSISTSEIHSTDILTEDNCIDKNEMCKYSTCQCSGTVIIEESVQISNVHIIFQYDFSARRDIIMNNVTAEFDEVNAQFGNLELHSTTIRMNVNSRISIENDLTLSETSIIVTLSSEEKQSIKEEDGQILLSFDKTLTGDFDAVEILVDGQSDVSLDLIREDNTYILKHKPSSSIIVIVIVIIIAAAVIATTIFIFAYPQTRECLVNFIKV